MATSQLRRCWLLALLPFFVTCRQVAGIDDRSVGRLECGIEFVNQGCGTCAAQHCCDEIARCAESPGCADLEGCLAKCDGDSACRSGCWQDQPLARDQGNAALDACLAGHCEAACGLTCGALYQLPPAEKAEECLGCLARNQCEETRACAKNADCQRHAVCRATCTTGDCVGSCAAADDSDVEYCVGKCKNSSCVRPCGAEYDADVELSSNLYATIGALGCQDACLWGKNWSCVGHLTQPPAEGPTRALSVAFAVSQLGTPAAGAAVKMCRILDHDCENPVSTGTTDANGLVRLVDGTGNEAGTGFGLDGYLDVASSQIYPTRLYWGFNLVESNGAFGVTIPLMRELDLTVGFASFGRFDKELGAVAASVVDCLGIQAPNVAVSLTDSEGQTYPPYYFDGKLLVADATSTSVSGSVFFVNIPPGSVTIKAHPVGLDRDSASVTIPMIRGGILTEVNLEPGKGEH